MMIRLLGTAVRFEDLDVGEDEIGVGARPGNMRASEPVATMMFLASSVWTPDSDFTSTLPLP